jgi:Ca2+-binding RTX toxin-like protein
MRHEHAGHAGQPHVSRTALAVAVGLLSFALLALAPAAANAAAGLTITPALPASVSIGSTGAGTIDLTNSGNSGTSTICNSTDTGTCGGSQGITLVPSCGLINVAGCFTADPGVFTINSPASGATGTACADKFFTVTDLGGGFGKVRFTPTTGSIVLSGAGATCRINFTFTVNQSPMTDAGAAPGRQTLLVAEADAVSDQGQPLTSRTGGDPVTVTLAAPVIVDTDPDSPSSINSLRVKGTAVAGTQIVTLYTDSNCTGTVVTSGTAVAFASPGFAVTIPDNTTRTYYATGTDADGGVTPCSAGLTYVEDSEPPAPPVPDATTPSSPANDNSPKVKGTAEPGSTVKIYTDATCTGVIAVQGAASTFASPGLTAGVPDDMPTTFYATATDAAGNTSGCSTASITYVEDSTAPPVPSTSGVTPLSPSNDNTPRVAGSATGGTTVKIYTNAACSGAVAGSGSATAFTSPGIQVMVPSNSTTTFYATATDAAGNASACSSGSSAYVEDSTAPAAPSVSGTQPGSPGSDNAPRIKGGAESGSTVRLYLDAACAGAAVADGSAASFASPGLLVSVADDSTTTYYARATDSAGNASACSAGVTYVEDSRAPTTTIDNTPATGNTPTFTFASSEPGATFECRLDSGAFTPCTSPYTVAAGLPAGAHTFEVRGVDAAGNRGAGAVRGFTVTSSVVPPPPPAPAKRAQPGCLRITGTIYVGTAAANTRTGGSKTDIMFGLGGNDSLRGASGLDCIYGAAGRDTLRGGNGNDRLFGGVGNDRLEGQAGTDRLSGQGGNDRLIGGTGNDNLTGAAGRDNLTDSRGRDRFSGGAGIDRIDSRDTRLADRRAVDRVLCGSGRDVVFADARDRVSRDCERVVRRSLPATY